MTFVLVCKVGISDVIDDLAMVEIDRRFHEVGFVTRPVTPWRHQHHFLVTIVKEARVIVHPSVSNSNDHVTTIQAHVLPE
jgi:hypothetical protein